MVMYLKYGACASVGLFGIFLALVNTAEHLPIAGIENPPSWLWHVLAPLAIGIAFLVLSRSIKTPDESERINAPADAQPGPPTE